MNFTKTPAFGFFLVFLFFIVQSLYAQSNENEKNKNLFIKGEQKWFERKLPEAKFLLNAYLQREPNPDDSNEVANTCDLMSNIFLLESKYDSALYFSVKSFEKIAQIKNKRLLPNFYQTKARIYNQIGDLTTTIQCFTLADSMYMASPEKKIHDIGVYTALALGNVYREQKQNEKAKEYFELAIQRAKELQDLNPVIVSLESLAFFHLENKEYIKAREIYYSRIFTLSRKLGGNPLFQYSSMIMGDIHLGLKNFDSAFFYYNTAAGLFWEGGELYQLDAIYSRLASAYFITGNINLAKSFSDSTLKWALKNNNLNYAIAATQILSDIAVSQKKYDLAYNHQRQKELYSDSLFNLKNIELSNNLYILNKVGQKDKAITALNQSNNVNKVIIQKGALINYLLIGVVCFTVLFFIIYLNRLTLKKQLEKQTAITKERERIITDLHDDVGATLSSMHIYGDLANTVWETQPKESQRMIEKISITSKELMLRMGDIIWSMKPADDEKYSFTARLKNYSTELLAAKNIECTFNVDENLCKQINHPDTRKNILLIVKEAMNNIAKYSGATKAGVALVQQNGNILLSINDNGKGYEAEKNQLAMVSAISSSAANN